MIVNFTKTREARTQTTAERYAIDTAKERDEYKCTICNATNLLHGHHLIPYKILIGTDDEYLIYDTENIITLCKDCHWDIHRVDDDLSIECIKVEEKELVFVILIKT